MGLEALASSTLIMGMGTLIYGSSELMNLCGPYVCVIIINSPKHSTLVLQTDQSSSASLTSRGGRRVVLCLIISVHLPICPTRLWGGGEGSGVKGPFGLGLGSKRRGWEEKKVKEGGGRGQGVLGGRGVWTPLPTRGRMLPPPPVRAAAPAAAAPRLAPPLRSWRRSAPRGPLPPSAPPSTGHAASTEPVQPDADHPVFQLRVVEGSTGGLRISRAA